MGSYRWYKSPDVLAMRREGGHGLDLVQQATGSMFLLDARQAEAWASWPDVESGINGLTDIQQSLAAGCFIRKAGRPGPRSQDAKINLVIPRIGGDYLRWYRETADLHVLFDTRPMRRNNPLLVLGPYGSLCWRGVAEGKTIGQIRYEAELVFGHDEVIPFLQRLASLGFIKHHPELGDNIDSGGFLTKEFHAPDIQNRLAHSAVPWYCLWEICTSCDLRCRTCYQNQFDSHGPTTEAALKIIAHLADAGIFYVSLMGGEPLMRDDLEEIICAFREANIFVKVITNGQQLTPHRARALATAGLNQVEISFDGLSAETHDKSRGPGTFDGAAAALRNALQGNIPRVGIVYTLHSGNIEEMERLPLAMTEFGIKECYISLFKKTGLQGACAGYTPLNRDELETCLSMIDNWETEFPQMTITFPSKCSCGLTSVVIGCNGDVRACPFKYTNAGNIHEKPLHTIWRDIGVKILESSEYRFCTDEVEALTYI